MARQPRKIPPELSDRIARALVWKVGLETLQKPSKQLKKRIQEGWKRFLWDVGVRAARGPLEQLAGLPSVDEVLASTAFELPDLRRSKPVLSHIKLKAEYNVALRQARVAFQADARPRRGVRIDAPTEALAKAFPDVPCARFARCTTARDAAIQVVRSRCAADHLSPATLGDLVNSKPKNRQAALDHERRAAAFDPDLTTAIRIALTNANLPKHLDLK